MKIRSSRHGWLVRALLPSLSMTASGALAAIPQKPLLIPQMVQTDDMVLAQQASAANDPSEALARYLRVLAHEPRDLEALTGAGRASLDIGDANAAVSFYARAEEVAPRDGRIKAGLGSAMVQLVQPRPALRLFEEAVEYGVPVADIAADRGLAYALRGDSKRARADFELALGVRRDPETIRRLALTQAIDGDMPSAMATLDPLLRRQDKAAWRARVFALAISGDVKTAQSIANAMLPKPQADALAPFLERIGKLRPSQQAAAVHFGQFPADGHIYSEAELFTAAGSTPPIVAAPAPSPKTPSRDRGALADDQGDGITERHRSEKPESKRPAGTTGAAADAVLTAKKPDIWAVTTRDSFSLRPPDDKKTETAKTPSKAAPEETKSLPAKSITAADRKESAADKKASDKKADPKTKASTSKSKLPERHWVQVATGAYKPDLGKEWDKLKAKYPALLGRRSAWITPLNHTNRVLIGPFKTSDEAQAFVNKAAGSGFATSRFTSAPGQAIDPLPQ